VGLCVHNVIPLSDYSVTLYESFAYAKHMHPFLDLGVLLQGAGWVGVHPGYIFC
jgi:hypothetical protein